MVLIYQVDGGPGDQNDFRLVPTDGWPHRTDVDPCYDGDSIGHWEGDTICKPDAGHVIERISRKGDALCWEAKSFSQAMGDDSANAGSHR